VLIVVAVTGIVCLGIGFGSGWMLSQRSAKKSFKAAMEQQSLENSPQQVKVQPTTQQPALPLPTTQTQQAGTSITQSASTRAAEPQLSFYKTLPSGQKNNALGSGINTKEDKPAKQPLQAAMPTNMTRTAASISGDNLQNPPAQSAPTASAVRQDANGFTVQVASYSLKSEAETLRSKMATKGYFVTIVESHQGDKGNWYRVRIGKHLDQDAAKELAGKLGKGAIAIPDKE
jgi:cell division septation protein DedD